MAMTYYEIPLIGQSQQLNISLGGKQYALTLIYRDVDLGGWFLDIRTTDGTDVLLGVPLVTGTDLLEQYPNLGFGGQLRVATDGNPDAVPTYGNLGSQSHVYFGVES